MSGRVFAIFFLALAALFGGALWYFQTRAYYEEVSGLTSIDVQGAQVPVSSYRGLDADTSPNKLRGCFTVDPAAFADVPEAPNPEPLTAPGWFPCFDVEAIATDLAEGRAKAYLAGDETPEGAEGYEILRMIAVYPDGRAYLWRHYREN
ncbi:DUF6446 family protein [Oceanibium sediminis]|uniref:DUF6446 family protein n=1 Tax=Oceanibium sediminis TaxID=2026339 RepID=UPI000DD2E445|nr:DUF6446 family protein [Oceanibium sediminis]